MSHLQSSGRGGAGNIVESAKSPKVKPQDLETPTLKESVVTTGRGGSGNMARNNDPAETRALQDVEPVPRRDSHGATHVGRGGTGNFVNSDEALAEAAVEDEEERERERELVKEKKEKERAALTDEESALGDAEKAELHPSPGWAEKGKQFLFGKR